MSARLLVIAAALALGLAALVTEPLPSASGGFALAAAGGRVASARPDVSAPPVPAPAPRPASPAPAWRNFELPYEGFSVDLPGEPVHEAQSSESEAGPVEGRAWSVETPGLVLRVEHYEIPRLAVMLLPDRRLLAMSATRVVEDRRGALQEREDWSLDGFPGLRLRYTRGDRGDVPEEARLVLVQRRLFIAFARITAAPGDDASAQAAVRRFFDSWSVWTPPAP